MPPGGETFRFSPRFGENELRHGSHEWLPYSKDEVRLKSSNTNFPFCRAVPIIPKGSRNCQLSRASVSLVMFLSHTYLR